MKNRFFILAILSISMLTGCLINKTNPANSNQPVNQETAVTNFTECLAAGYPILESYPRQCKTPQGLTFAENIGNELEKQNLIKIDNPRPNQAVTSPLEITGQARGYWFFEASFPIKLVDAGGNILATGIAQAQSDWMTNDFVPFKATLEFNPMAAKTGELILQKDNPSGLPENDDELRLPLAFFGETASVKIFLTTKETGNNPDFNCQKTAAVGRTIPKTLALGKAALAELLKGPTESEIAQGFSTTINTGVKLQKLTIENGVAKADFSQELEYQVGGSCRISAIRAQISDTLKQFSSVKEVIISIDGRTEDILQP
ncbi:MAG: GerMN domain-containing protein [Patescibacteria group bacterium]|jgi:hypothetical protein